jgi:hypothetical protein
MARYNIYKNLQGMVSSVANNKTKVLTREALRIPTPLASSDSDEDKPDIPPPTLPEMSQQHPPDLALGLRVSAS